MFYFIIHINKYIKIDSLIFAVMILKKFNQIIILTLYRVNKIFKKNLSLDTLSKTSNCQNFLKRLQISLRNVNLFINQSVELIPHFQYLIPRTYI